MTPYSASRGIRYTAPPGPDGNRRDVEDEEASEPSTAEVEADGGEANGMSRPSSAANTSDGGPADAATDAAADD